MPMMGGGASAAMGVGMMGVADLMSSRGRRPALSPQEQTSLARKSQAEGTLSSMFQERAKDPFAYVMPLEDQKYYDQRRDQIYGEERGRQQQGLMGAMNRTGAMASGATNINLMRFGQQTLRDKQQFYFQDQATRLQQREGAVQSTFGMGMQILGAPVQGKEWTNVMTTRNREHNAYRNRWSTALMSMGSQAAGAGMGEMTSSMNQMG